MTLASGAAGTETTGQAGASGAVILESAAGGAATGLNGEGGDSGTLTIRTGAGGALTEGAGTGGDGGVIAITGGRGGEDTEDNDATGGLGANVNITAGQGGDGQTAGAGGSVVVTPGAIGADGGGGPPINGAIFLKGDGADPVLPLFRGQATEVTETGAQTIVVGDLLNGIYVNDPTGAARAITMPNGDDLRDACPADLAIGDSFDFTMINTGSTAEPLTLTDAGGNGTITFVGSAIVDAFVTTESSGSSIFRFRFTGSSGSTNGTWTVYRIA